MNASNIGLDLADDQILNDEFSDEALERAGGLENRAVLTIAMLSRYAFRLASYLARSLSLIFDSSAFSIASTNTTSSLNIFGMD